MDLARLQGLVKKDPESYKEEFLEQQQRFESKLTLLELQPGKDDEDFVSLVNFLCHTVPCYPEKDTSRFPAQLMTMLEEKYGALEKETRKSMLQGLIILRNRNRVDPLRLLIVCFTLFRVHDKELRNMVYRYIVNDIHNVNKKQKSEKINRALQHQLYAVLEDKTNEVAAKKSLDVMIELYKRQVWFDSKTVNVISTAVFSLSPRIVIKALRFLLGENLNEEVDSDDEDVRQKSLRELQATAKYAKHSKSRIQKIKKIMHDHRTKAQRAKNKTAITESSIILALNDPQGFAEKLFAVLKKSTLKFEARLLMMNVISRCIAIHQLVIINFYPYMQKYLRPHQQDVTMILAMLAQACHVYVPSDVLHAIVKVITENFVNEGCSNEMMTVGINSIREICARNSDAMSEDLLSDLVMYKDQKDKGVSVAARSLLRLFRQVNPKMLPKTMRGKPMERGEEDELQEPSAMVPLGRIEGIELLEQEQAGGLDSSDEEGGSDEEGMEEAGQSEVEEADEEEGDEGAGGSSDEGDAESEEPSDDDDNDSAAARPRSASNGPAESGSASGSGQAAAAIPLEATRLLTQEEFQRLKVLRLKRKLGAEASLDLDGPAKKKAKSKPIEEMTIDSSDLDEDEDEGQEFLGEDDIIGYQSRKRKTLEERMDSVRAGREGREKFGSSKGKKKELKGTTNADKQRNQPFMMSKWRQASRKKKAAKDKKRKQRNNFRGKVRK